MINAIQHHYKLHPVGMLQHPHATKYHGRTGCGVKPALGARLPVTVACF